MAATALPYSRHGGATTVAIEGQPAEPGRRPMAWVQSVTDGYFAALHVPLLAGRLPGGADIPSTVRVAAVSRSMAQRWWPGNTAIGKRVRTGSGAWVEIVGIVGDVEHSVLDRNPAPTLYLPFTQAPQRAMDVAVRATSD